jgi:hypothetical protein
MDTDASIKARALTDDPNALERRAFDRLWLAAGDGSNYVLYMAMAYDRQRKDGRPLIEHIDEIVKQIVG